MLSTMDANLRWPSLTAIGELTRYTHADGRSLLADLK
jgi:hypothetical protein